VVVDFVLVVVFGGVGGVVFGMVVLFVVCVLECL